MKKVLVSLTEENAKFYQRIPDKQRSKVVNQYIEKLRMEEQKQLAADLVEIYKNLDLSAEQHKWDELTKKSLDNSQYGWGNS